MERFDDPYDDTRIHTTPAVIEPGHTFGSVTDKISALVLRKRTPVGWFVGFAISFMMTGVLMGTITYLVLTGIGIWGNNQPVGWAFDIINFVWWIGIGHAGTLISAILLLLRQQWRTSINRFAEAMTLFAVACAGLFPLLHTGRPWLAYWLFPYPNTMGIQPQFRSPLMWDVFAVSTYATVSALFWYTGLVPDLATLRDRARSKFGRVVFGMMSLGWRGSARHWARYEVVYLLLAGISTPLVLSVHTIVSFDFAVGIIPGWHTPIFPPYFVAGAIYAGFAMVLTLIIPLRKFYGLEDFITDRHLRNAGKVMLATGLLVAYGYMSEAFIAWYSANTYEQFMMINRFVGPYAFYYWSLITCNVIVPQLLWIRRVRHSHVMLFVVAMFVNVGMWLERFIIIPISLHRDFLPSSWGMYAPTVFDFTMFFGTIGFFFFLMLLFIRFLPVISIFEMRTMVPEAQIKEEA
ncbi:MAG TPA: NrfD/PsrC family molybdoenzyme membrane anchor subunit [Pyrinomonadaceae bacterium]|nr:NrfD/PsrC family molybdoenzyme membrane anchor subunit [Pyrinomonadaceae bacterium]